MCKRELLGFIILTLEDYSLKVITRMIREKGFLKVIMEMVVSSTIILELTKMEKRLVTNNVLQEKP